MRISYLYSLLFAFLASASVAVHAAPASPVLPPTAPAVTAPVVQGNKVNINAANADTLQKELVGVGVTKAAAIVAYREENGPFSSVDELIEVKGIGPALLDKNRNKLSLD